MARMPGVEFLGIKGAVMTVHNIVCIHTIVGYQDGGNAAHFTTGASGKIVQARDTNVRSEANFNGNGHVIAIENEDHGPAYGKWSGSDVPPFTHAQAEAIARILVWAHNVHAIPLGLVPDSKPGRRGIAYHRQGVNGNFTGQYRGRVAGGEEWSRVFGKVCPGDARIAQLISEIIPRARVLAAKPGVPAQPTTQEGFLMSIPDAAQKQLVTDVTFIRRYVRPDPGWKIQDGWLESTMSAIRKENADMKAAMTNLSAAVDKLSKAVSSLASTK